VYRGTVRLFFSFLSSANMREHHPIDRVPPNDNVVPWYCDFHTLTVFDLEAIRSILAGPIRNSY